MTAAERDMILELADGARRGAYIHLPASRSRHRLNDAKLIEGYTPSRGRPGAWAWRLTDTGRAALAQIRQEQTDD